MNEMKILDFWCRQKGLINFLLEDLLISIWKLEKKIHQTKKNCKPHLFTYMYL